MMVDLNVVIAGAAGEGVQTVGEVLARAIAGHGYAVYAWQEFESRIRGGRTVIRSGSAKNRPMRRP
ncbi:MAG: 2-oxoacid:acceptor oxidoreductase family protein [Desulfosarcina sp.]